MTSSANINDYTDGYLIDWIKRTFIEYKQDQDEPRIFKYSDTYKGKKRKYEIRIANYYGDNKKFISTTSQRWYGNYMGGSSPCDTFEEVIENEKRLREYIKEDEEKEIKYYETIPLF